jgi:hypothetical protein
MSATAEGFIRGCPECVQKIDEAWHNFESPQEPAGRIFWDVQLAGRYRFRRGGLDTAIIICQPRTCLS